MRRFLMATICLLLVTAPAQAQTVLWFMGVETGDLQEGQAIGSTPSNATASTSPVHTGNYSLDTLALSGRGSTAVLAGTTMFARTYFQWVSTGSGNNNRVVVASGPGGQTIEVILIGSTAKLAWNHNNGATIAGGTQVLTGSTWYRLDIEFVISASVGGVIVKINGTTDITSLGTNTSDLASFDIIGFGPTLSLASEYVYDDMMVCSGAFCPNGGTIARQGTSGSPTYTAWTKNSCTSSLIENCWSQTPFNATPNASDAVASDAQTMLVHGFDTTQSGHGSETLLGFYTINACKTAMVAKSGTASAPVSIRRIISAANTDTSEILTTSDAYYDDGIWTTSAANLLAAAVPQVGAVHGAGSATDTVEDMWLICDFSSTPVSGTAHHRVIMR